MSPIRLHDFGRKFFCEADGRVGFADFRFEVVGGKTRTPESSRATISASRDLGRIGEDRIHREAYGELPALAIVDRAARGTDFKYALLLVLGFCEVVAVAEKLEITQAGQHRHHPNHRHDPNDQPAETRIALLHGFRPTLSRNSFGEPIRQVAGTGSRERAAKISSDRAILSMPMAAGRASRLASTASRLRQQAPSAPALEPSSPIDFAQSNPRAPGDRSEATSSCKLLVQFRGLRALRLQLLHLVAQLNALEMLPGVKQQSTPRARRQSPGGARNPSAAPERAGRASRELSIRFTV